MTERKYRLALVSPELEGPMKPSHLWIGSECYGLHIGKARPEVHFDEEEWIAQHSRLNPRYAIESLTKGEIIGILDKNKIKYQNIVDEMV